MLLFMYPILVDLRKITKLFQLKTGNNLEIFSELKQFILDLCKRILKPAIIERNNFHQLLALDLSTDFCLLHIDDVNYGSAYLDEISKFNTKTQVDLKTRARNYIKILITGFQNRLSGTLNSLKHTWAGSWTQRGG